MHERYKSKFPFAIFYKYVILFYLFIVYFQYLYFNQKVDDLELVPIFSFCYASFVW